MTAVHQVTAFRCNFVVPRAHGQRPGPKMFRERYDDQDDESDDEESAEPWRSYDPDRADDDDEPFDPEPTTEGAYDDFELPEVEPEPSDPPPDLWTEADWE